MTLRLSDVEAMTFDFGNTLVPVGRDALRRVVELTADDVVGRTRNLDRGAFLRIWSEERDRQFAENVPRFREVDIGERLVRVFARLRGMAPPDDGSWDQEAAARFSQPGEIEAALDAYSSAFIEGMPPRPGVLSLLRALRSRAIRLAILSNWPLAVTIDRYADAYGWTDALDAIVVSERIGVIKPHPAIFEAGRAAVGSPDSDQMAHVGDDWAADVVGARRAGWRTVWVADRPDDTPLPTSDRDDDVEADLTIATLDDLAPALGLEPVDSSRIPTESRGR